MRARKRGKALGADVLHANQGQSLSYPDRAVESVINDEVPTAGSSCDPVRVLLHLFLQLTGSSSKDFLTTRRPVHEG
eukprot:294426-Prymnesium_polylepis.1